MSWVTVAGVSDDRVIIIFRGDGLTRKFGDMGAMAAALADDGGSGGGHKTMARAEIPLKALDGLQAGAFIWERLTRTAGL